MQLNRNEIFEKLKDIILISDDKNQKIVASCTEDSKLITDLGLSSVGMLYIIIAAEETFGIRFENVGMADFETVGNVIDYIEGKLK